MEDRLIELEIKLAFQEDLLESLNKIVSQQQLQLDAQQEQLRELYRQLQAMEFGPRGAPQQEIPPHY
ncbi:MAG TPA: SlyX family protein [Chitinolyticbacter sp.]|uniref:SlyX family protein n=1 Tax=Chitinolyticbacter albus TaxID=2961951 RepID=UPI00210C7FE4|nr:SlyX family protein [Chitinolyticbacter albus]HSC79445.1 SlyX family protein [Chitinolyticbacter sp.]